MKKDQCLARLKQRTVKPGEVYAFYVEMLGLEAAENDAAWKDEIKKFWDRHLPVFLSLEGGYAYYAISIKEGSIVYGSEPEFEECQIVADSFENFMEKIISKKIRL